MLEECRLSSLQFSLIKFIILLLQTNFLDGFAIWWLLFDFREGFNGYFRAIAFFVVPFHADA